MQAESIIGNIRGQLSEEDVPLYQGPVTEGLIPVHIPPAFLEDIDKLGTVGGGTSAGMRSILVRIVRPNVCRHLVKSKAGYEWRYMDVVNL